MHLQITEGPRAWWGEGAQLAVAEATNICFAQTSLVTPLALGASLTKKLILAFIAKGDVCLSRLPVAAQWGA